MVTPRAKQMSRNSAIDKATSSGQCAAAIRFYQGPLVGSAYGVMAALLAVGGW